MITSSHTPGKDSKGAEETSKSSKDSKGKEPGKDAWSGNVLHLWNPVEIFKMFAFSNNVQALNFVDHHPCNVDP